MKTHKLTTIYFALTLLFALLSNCAPALQGTPCGDLHCIEGHTCIKGKCVPKEQETPTERELEEPEGSQEEILAEVAEDASTETPSDLCPEEVAIDSGEESSPDEILVESESSSEETHEESTTETSGEQSDNDIDPCPIKQRICYTGPANTRLRGLCRDGNQTCTAGIWSQCIDEVLPKTEICDDKDNDCDGQADQGIKCNCKASETRACGSSDKGVCKFGTQSCQDGEWQDCVGSIEPIVEKCDGQDNDCDGQVDEELGSTTCGVGACKTTINNCSNGKPVNCAPDLSKKKLETCNSIDDDCDGQVDEEIPKVSCGKGVCKQTVSGCEKGVVPSCTPKKSRGVELCSKPPDDNNCDGQDNNDCDKTRLALFPHPSVSHVTDFSANGHEGALRGTATVNTTNFVTYASVNTAGGYIEVKNEINLPSLPQLSKG
ncbi:hypothetical protein KKC60_03725, partial [Patescibacteria group bacterium]|nr:hypothetical protein [Patescibacteria group bacterium]